MQGLSAGIFWSSVCAVTFAAVGFSTSGWTHSSGVWTGLWGSYTSSSAPYFSGLDWFKAVQAMACLGIIFLGLAFILIFLYSFIHNWSLSKSLILKLIVSCSFVSVLSILIALCIYGNKTDPKTLHWSYAFFAIGGIFTLLVLILSCVQMKSTIII